MGTAVSSVDQSFIAMRHPEQAPCYADSGRTGTGPGAESHARAWTPRGPRPVTAAMTMYLPGLERCCSQSAAPPNGLLRRRCERVVRLHQTRPDRIAWRAVAVGVPGDASDHPVEGR